MRIKLDYGRTGLDVELPAERLVGPLEIRPAPPLPDASAAIRAALASPTGTPPLAFTYGLGAELVFPLRFGAATAVMTGPTPDHLREGIARFGATRVFTAPTAYRALLAQAGTQAVRSVRSFVSAGDGYAHDPLHVCSGA